MINKKALMTPLLLTLLLTGIDAHADDLINGRLFLPSTSLPSAGLPQGAVKGHFPGMEVWVTTSSKDGKIYTGGVLGINYKLVDKDQDWADEQAIQNTVYWYYLKSDGQGGYEADGEAFLQGELSFRVPESAKGKMIGVAIGPKTAVGYPSESGTLDVFDLSKTYALVPEGLESQYGNRAAGTVFAIGTVSQQNNITDVEIQLCPDGETCEGAGGGPQEAISEPGIYIYDITGMEDSTLARLDAAGRRFTKSNTQHASVAKTYRAVVFDNVKGALTDITEPNKAGITWSLQERGQTIQLFTKSDILNFATQKTNLGAQARSQAHKSEQGLTIKVSVKTSEG